MASDQHAGAPSTRQQQHATLLTALPIEEGIFMRRLLCDGFLVRELGALAITSRSFGGRWSAGLWGQRDGLCPVEAAVRVRLSALRIPGCRPAIEFPLYQSAGRALLSRTFATPGLKFEDGTLRGWVTPAVRLVIPYGVTAIGEVAFKDCTTIITTSIPGSVTSIGNSAFAYCSSATAITIPASVTSIGNSAFRGCSSATTIAIPGSVTSIGAYVFNNCYSATFITIPGSVTSIGQGAFSGCSSATAITIPGSVTSIGRLTFFGCSSADESR